MKNTYRLYLILFISTLFLSCETDITVDLPKHIEKIIVEGKIENNEKAFVFLSRNTGYFEEVSFPEIADLNNINEFIEALKQSYGLIYDSTAVITISNGTQTDTLIPSFTTTDFPYFGYQSKTMTGEIGASYRLDINYNNETCYANTTIPTPLEIDSVWFEFMEDNDTIGSLGMYVKDMPSTRNFFLLSSKILNEQIAFNPPYWGREIYDDEFIMNDTILVSPIFKGYDKNAFFQSEVDFENNEHLDLAFFKFGSTVDIKISSIDIEAFLFWTSLMKQQSTSGNPFANPTSIKSNIIGDKCEGIWAGYGSTIKQVTIDNSLIKQDD